MQFSVGGATLTRVPYFDIPLEAAIAGLTAEQVRAVPWAEPVWATDGQVLIGQAVWVIESSGRVMVVDPCGAADAFIRSGPAAVEHQEAVMGALRAAGFPPERVDAVFLSHLDGIGMAALVDGAGAWAPAFPDARILITRPELEWLASAPGAQGAEVFRGLVEQGAVDAIDCPHAFTDEVVVELTGGHTPGHAVVWVRSAGQSAALLGHLSLNPVQLAYEQGPAQHIDAAAAARALDAVLTTAAGDGALIAGPLWPAPGAGRVTGPPWMVAADQGNVAAAAAG